MDSAYSVQISGIGLCSSLGGYRDACAAFRAGLNRYTAHDSISVMNPGDEEAEPLTIAPANIGQGYQGTGRMTKMLLQAYQDLAANIGAQIPFEDLQILLALPNPADREHNADFAYDTSREERLRAYSERITSPLFERIDKRLNDLPMQMVFGDRIAFPRILEKGAQLLAEGQAQHGLLLVADSLLDDKVLDTLRRRRQLKTSDNPVGFIPGEGAAVIWLSRTGTTSEAFATASLAIAIDRSTVKVQDPDDESAEFSPEERQSWLGAKLMAVVKMVLTSSYEQQFLPQMVSDINGQENRAIEWGMMQTLLKRDYPQATSLAEQIPALSFGETGTMTGALGLATIIASVQRGYARNREFLITLSERDGKRAVIKLNF